MNLIFGATVPLQAFANWKEMTEILTKRVHLTSNSWAYINKHYNLDHAKEKKKHPRVSVRIMKGHTHSQKLKPISKSNI